MAATFGVTIPTQSICAGHTSPAEAFLDAFRARSSVSLWIASRGFGGKTSLLAVLALTNAILLEVDVVVLGGSGQQSSRVVDRVHRLLASGRVPRAWLVGEPGLYKTQFIWGNTIEALTASPTAVRGAHPVRLLMDEIDEMELRILEAAQGQPMDRGMVRAHTVMSSTHQHANGTVTAMIQRAAETGWAIHRWCYHETMEPHGWLSTAQVRRKKLELSQRMWVTEYELQEPSAEGRAMDPDAVDRMFEAPATPISQDALARIWRGEAGIKTHRIFDGPRGPWYTVGVDWAQKRDYTVAVVFRCDTRPFRVVAVYRTHRLPWPEMTERVGSLLDEYEGPAAHDNTGAGAAIREFPALASRHQLLDVTLVGRDRTDLFRNYIGAVERGEIVCPRIDVVYNDHKYCTEEDLFYGGHPPDTLVAMALAYHAFKTGREPGDFGISI